MLYDWNDIHWYIENRNETFTEKLTLEVHLAKRTKKFSAKKTIIAI
jgi:hypothetical protein